MKGRVLAGKYRLVAELGRGGMGSVWRADHIELRSPVAVKLIDPTLAETREGQSRFLREARAAGSLRSTHVVSVFDYGVDDGTPFLVMELLEGESLAARLEKRGRLSLSEVSAIIKQVARGLAKAHGAGIVHRDLKPENIFITTEGDSEVVKVLDFGIAKVEANIAVSVQTQTGMVLGTPYYMSPEQAEGRRELDTRSDIWSLGVIVYECLLGTRPFDGDNLAQIILAICAEPLPIPSKAGEPPIGFDVWFARAVARRLDDRYQTVQELSDELARLGAATSVAVAVTEPAPAVLLATSASAETPTAAASPNPAASPSSAAATPAASLNPVSAGEARPLDGSSDAFKNSSHEWSKDPAPNQGSTSSYQTGSVRAVSTTARLAAGALLVALLASAGVGGWLWANVDGRADAEVSDGAAAVTGPEMNTQPRGLTALPADVDVAETAAPRHVATTSAAPTADSANSASETQAASSKSSGYALPIPEAVTAQTVSASHRAPSLPVARPPASVSVAGKGGSSRPVIDTGGLYCSHNSISGRLVRSKPGKAGSFPCYVHALSGELRKKD